jgi:sulfide:quinone oxidoreductase
MRKPSLDIAVIEPNDRHYYQPGYTLAGAGVFKTPQLSRDMQHGMPERVRWIRTAAAAFDPDNNQVILEDAGRVTYQQLVVAPGLKLDWQQIDGLTESLGSNGVTSNYRHVLTSYTWELVQSLKSGRALFTQPLMPIKCAGPPQKALYLSCDHWLRQSCLNQIEVEFYNAGGVLFGI